VRLENCNFRTARVEALLRRDAIRIGELPGTVTGILIIRNRE
jgi:hypothetical protein